MENDKDELEDLKQRAKFLRREKQRLLDEQRKRNEIKRLSKEVAELRATQEIQSTKKNNVSSEELDAARKAGQWLDDSTEEDVIFEAGFEQEKIRLKEKEKNDKAKSEKALWGCFGALAFFFPIFWPFFIVQTFRAYPVVSFATLALIVILLIIVNH